MAIYMWNKFPDPRLFPGNTTQQQRRLTFLFIIKAGYKENNICSRASSGLSQSRGERRAHLVSIIYVCLCVLFPSGFSRDGRERGRTGETTTESKEAVADQRKAYSAVPHIPYDSLVKMHITLELLLLSFQPW